MIYTMKICTFGGNFILNYRRAGFSASLSQERPAYRFRYSCGVRPKYSRKVFPK